MRLLLSFINILVALTAAAINPMQIRWHNEATDTTTIDSMLEMACARPLEKSAGETIDRIGRMFLGTPYVAHTLEGDPEMLTISPSQLDCTTFVETVMAMTKTLRENRRSWRDFAHNLESIRYRNGQLDGYPSRLHYIAEWVIDNRHRGNIIEVTETFPGYAYTTKTIDFMTAHRDRYPALADTATYQAMRAVESKLKLHKFPYVKTAALSQKATKQTFRTGDIVSLTTSLKDLDVTHMGIIVLIDGEPYLLHASSSLGKVTVTEVPLDRFMQRNKSLTGLRVFRLR